MAVMMLGYDNHADDAAVSLAGGSWTARALSYVQDPRPGSRARSANATLSATQFTVDLGSSRTLRIIAFGGTNLSSTALIRITRYSDAFITAIDNTGWVAVNGCPADDPDNVGASHTHIYASDTAARYWKIEIDDHANAAGYVEIGRLMMPTTYIPPYDFGPPATDGLEANTPGDKALSGTSYFNRYQPARTFKGDWSTLPSSEDSIIRRIRKICNLDKQVWFVPDPDDTANFAERNFLGTLKTLPSIGLLSPTLRSSGFEIVETV